MGDECLIVLWKVVGPNAGGPAVRAAVFTCEFHSIAKGFLIAHDNTKRTKDTASALSLGKAHPQIRRLECPRCRFEKADDLWVSQRAVAARKLAFRDLCGLEKLRKIAAQFLHEWSELPEQMSIEPFEISFTCGGWHV